MSCKKTLTKNASIVHLSFVFFFLTLVALLAFTSFSASVKSHFMQISCSQ